jgi:hypothetical protein
LSLWKSCHNNCTETQVASYITYSMVSSSTLENLISPCGFVGCTGQQAGRKWQ